MLTADELRKKISTSGDLQVIVRTMKSLAAVNMHHYSEIVKSVSEYYGTVELGLQVVLNSGMAELPAVRGDDEGGLGAVIFGSDQGLCGGFNDRIVSYAMDDMLMHENKAEGRAVLSVGMRAAALLDIEGQPVAGSFSIPASHSGITLEAQKVLLKIEHLQAEGKVNKVVLYHNRPVSGMSYEPSKAKLFPLDISWLEQLKSRKWPTKVLPAFTMDRSRLFSALVRQYIFISLFRAFAESMAGENASRFSSMQTAEKNISERLDELNASYRRQRQGAITGELFDIVAGFEAMRTESEK